MYRASKPSSVAVRGLPRRPAPKAKLELVVLACQAGSAVVAGHAAGLPVAASQELSVDRTSSCETQALAVQTGFRRIAASTATCVALPSLRPSCRPPYSS